MKGLPLAYNKDMQEDKEPLFDAVATAATCVAILPDLLDAMKPRPDRMAQALRDDGPDLAECKRVEDGCYASADYREGRRAFMEKRKPRFTGS